MSTPDARIADLLENAPTAANPAARPPPPPPGQEPRTDGPTLRVTVLWGDLSEVAADLHVTGHYQSVVPADAELALDRAISAGPRGLITAHTKLGWIDAQLGEVTYFPCADGTVRSAAVVGMGPMGTLTERRAGQLYASLLGEAVALGHVATMATVLIGSGTGNLSVRQAVRALVRGFSQVLTALPASPAPRLTQVLLVEVDRLRAEQLHLALTEATAHLPQLTTTPEVREGGGGRLSRPSAAVYALAALTGLGGPDDESALRAVLKDFDDGIQAQIREQLTDLATVRHTDLSLTVGRSAEAPDGSVPVRMSVQSGVGGLRWAALTGRATIPERLVPVEMGLLRELVDRLTEPSVEDARELPGLLSRFVVPSEFQRLLTDDATVLLELDRDTASVPWEFLTEIRQAGAERRDPLAIRTQLSRQLRTPYSRVMTEALSDGPLRALVIGDPGDPEKGFRLPGAREEALGVAAQLRELGVDVTLFIGATNASREQGVDLARRLDVLRVLLCGGNHIVHYCGHGDFDFSGTGRRAGWVFADGLLTSQELAMLEQPPLIVMANACYTARLAGPTGPGTGTGTGVGAGAGGGAAGAGTGAQPVPSAAAAADRTPWGNPQAALVPSLADEFLRAGVGHYIGAAWRIPDDQAVTFARQFYKNLFAEGTGDGAPTVGAAVRAARKAIHQPDDASGQVPGTVANGQRQSAWAAYQHYGDAAEPFTLPGTSDRPGGQ
ncbi:MULTISPECIES: CHAT domain-containing protein [unclassified Streptomyces]|uniref:CHAT domain-containing protein n=1 Tax=unclassified Streptomyces TaxID=2593676 RepID=UPI0005EC9482|nr:MULTISPECIES: CHAT domain-containing protein [unclassified Streptomyces]APU43594.1 hypothetical protein BSL84_31505 [Streptomyces sp. TN58]KJK51471.1 hypothetical protein UK14_11410 [Streptomyces sp. NRRL F-4428]